MSINNPGMTSNEFVITITFYKQWKTFGMLVNESFGM